jgi:hypothetical protein
MYDTVSQYGQVLTDPVTDWHPPIMVRLWQLLHPLAGSTSPMFLVQAALYALGFALIVAALVKSGRWRAGAAAAILGLSPLLLGWQMVVLKDAQMLGALVAACGILLHFRLAGRRISPLPTAAVAVLIAYATLVRANALFATVPLAVLLLPRPRSILYRAGIAAVSILALLVAIPEINHRVLGAEPSGVAKSQPLFDLAAIAIGAPRAPSPFTPAEREQIAARRCVKNFFWDPLGDPNACAPVVERLNARPEADLYAELARAAADHPIAYAAHRLKHWNSTERWLVASNLPDAAPPIEAEPNDVGLGTPTSAVAATWQDAAALEASTPAGWPIVWTVIAVLLLPAAWRRRSEGAGGLALALLVSALALEVSFLVISIASDLRYHLWSMAASGLALVLLSDRAAIQRRELIAGGAALLLVIVGGLFTRASLPRAPDSYEAMIHAPSG